MPFTPPTSCWHINEERCLSIGVNIQKPLQLERETCLLGTDHDKNCPLPMDKHSKTSTTRKRNMFVGN